MMRQFLWLMLMVLMVGCSVGETAVLEPGITSTKVAAETATQQPALRAVVVAPADDEAATATPVLAVETVPAATVAALDNLEKKLAAELGEAVILYQKSGGIMGLNESWWIYENGRLRDKQGNEWQLPAKDVATFLASSKQLGLAQMQPSYIPDGFCCDQFVYGLTVRRDDGIYQVVTADGVEGTPAGLFRLIEQATMMVAERDGS